MIIWTCISKSTITFIIKKIFTGNFIRGEICISWWRWWIRWGMRIGTLSTFRGWWTSRLTFRRMSSDEKIDEWRFFVWKNLYLFIGCVDEDVVGSFSWISSDFCGSSDDSVLLSLAFGWTFSYSIDWINDDVCLFVFVLLFFLREYTVDFV
jgi:hypothetical protein